MRKLLVTAAATLALATAPTIAAAQTAGAPVDARAGEVRPASEQVEGSEIRGGFILPLLLVAAIILALYLLTKDNPDDMPVSP